MKAVDNEALGKLTGIPLARNGQALHAASICPGLTREHVCVVFAGNLTHVKIPSPQRLTMSAPAFSTP